MTREMQARDNIEAAIQRRRESFRLLHLEHRVDDYRVTFAEGSVHVTEGRVDEDALEKTPSPALEDLLDKIRSLSPKPREGHHLGQEARSPSRDLSGRKSAISAEGARPNTDG